MKMNALKKLAIPLFVAFAYGPAQGLAEPILGPDLATFAVLGATGGVTNVPTSTIGGNLGAFPSDMVGGGYLFTAGSLQPGNEDDAQLDLDAAFVTLGAFGVGTNTGSDLDAYQALNGGVIIPGTYTVAATTTPNLTGDLILDGQGNIDAVWVFQFPSTFITSTTSNVSIQNVGDGSGVGVYWNVGSAATLNGPTMVGNVLARELISSDGNLTVACGRLLVSEGAVTLIQDSISIVGCGADNTPGGGSGGFDQGADIGSGGIVVGAPEPGTLLLFGFGLAGLFTFRKRLFPVA
jgi:hypothetical protein